MHIYIVQYCCICCS